MQTLAIHAPARTDAHGCRAEPNIRLIGTPPAALPDPDTCAVAVIGLGYVGLPLLAGFSSAAHCVGFDIDQNKLTNLRNGLDETGEISSAEVAALNADLTSDPSAIASARAIVVCVPTPVDECNRPDYGPLLAASRTIGRHMTRGAVVIFESTVDPGTTETRCLPVIEHVSGMKEGVDFHIGYSPERINPGDPQRKLADIKKIVAGRSEVVTEFLVRLYGRVVTAGLYPAPSIRVAEAAKILENTQRDLNIALMNEMMALFDKMGIRSSDVIAAAGSKWNFHHYRPGLVGGHCIAVDPYYLLDAGRRHGLAMNLVAAARIVNENTPHFLVEKLADLLRCNGHSLKGARVLVLGRTFKEDCPDIRNSKAYPLMDALWAAGADVFSFDPVAADTHFEGGRGVVMLDDCFAGEPYDAIVITLAHTVFRQQLDHPALRELGRARAPLIDLRGNFDTPENAAWFNYWRP